MKGKIAVTGAAGYIGSHTLVDLLMNGYDVVSIDNFSTSSEFTLEQVKKITGKNFVHYTCDLVHLPSVQQIFQEEKDIVGIIHFAAFKTVPESVSEPLMYYNNNLRSLLNILACVEEFKIPHFVFSSSCSVYGNATQLPVTEETPLAAAESPYAATKQMGEQIIMDCQKSESFHAMLLRYFNPAGAHPSGTLGEVPYDHPNNLTPILTQAAAKLRAPLQVWGNDYPTPDGTCIRDYIHVMDIAHAHTLAMEVMLNPLQQPKLEIINLGSGKGISVLEAIRIFEEVNQVEVPYQLGPRRAGDVVSIYSDNRKAKTILQWEPQYSVHEIMRTAWNWQMFLKDNPITKSR
jgi:UDP-glucose 4-epimerase